jgi:hypothetical protein
MITGNVRETRSYLLRSSDLGGYAIDELLETGIYTAGGTIIKFYELEDYGDNDGVMVTRRCK